MEKKDFKILTLRKCSIEEQVSERERQRKRKREREGQRTRVRVGGGRSDI